MTIRMASCRELSADKEAIDRLGQHFRDIEKNATPITVLFPWFPGSSKRAKRKATQALYDLLLSYVNLRRNASIPSSDPIDLFISQGLSDSIIIEVRPF
jgi:sterol 14-demethylase